MQAKLVAYTPCDAARVLDALEARCAATTQELLHGAFGAAAPRVPADVPPGDELTYFHSRSVPPTPLKTLAASIVRAQIAVDDTTVAIAAALMHRFAQRRASPPTAHMMHRLLVACLLVAAKAHQDRFPANKLLARVVGVKLSELNRLEKKLVEELDWRVVVTRDDLAAAVADLCPETPEAPVREHSAASSTSSSYKAASDASRCSASPAARSSASSYVCHEVALA